MIGDGDEIDDETMRECLGKTLQAGNKLRRRLLPVLGGHVVRLLLRRRHVPGVHARRAGGEFVLTQPNMQIPTRGKPIYSINEANRWQWDERSARTSPTSRTARGRRARRRATSARWWRHPPHAGRPLRLPGRHQEPERQAAPALRGGADRPPDGGGGRQGGRRRRRPHPRHRPHQRPPARRRASSAPPTTSTRCAPTTSERERCDRS